MAYPKSPAYPKSVSPCDTGHATADTGHATGTAINARALLSALLATRINPPAN